MLLSHKEREKFALWCEREAKSDDEMADQLEKILGNKLSGVEGQLAKRMKQRAMAYSIVALELQSIEDIEIER